MMGRRTASFTPDELYAMRMADEEIELEFSLTPSTSADEFIDMAKELDREALDGALDARERAERKKARERAKRWNEQNRKRHDENVARYYAEHREQLLVYKREYYRKNKDRLLQKQREQRKARKAVVPK